MSHDTHPKAASREHHAADGVIDGSDADIQIGGVWYPAHIGRRLLASMEKEAAEATDESAARRLIEIRLEHRLIRAWRGSGLSLGKLVVLAANEYVFGAAVSLTGICDEALVDHCERYVREHVAPSTPATKTPPG